MARSSASRAATSASAAPSPRRSRPQKSTSHCRSAVARIGVVPDRRRRADHDPVLAPRSVQRHARKEGAAGARFLRAVFADPRQRHRRSRLLRSAWRTSVVSVESRRMSTHAKPRRRLARLRSMRPATRAAPATPPPPANRTATRRPAGPPPAPGRSARWPARAPPVRRRTPPAPSTAAMAATAHHASSAGTGGRRAAPFRQPPDHREEQRDEEDPDQRGAEHAEEHAGAQRMAALGAGAAGEQQRRDAEDERERRHQDRPEPLPGRLAGRVEDRRPLVPQCVGELDDQDGVLRRQADHRDQRHFEIDVVRHAADPDAQQRAEGAERHAEQHRERDAEALVLRRQHQEHEDQAEAEDQPALPAGHLLLVGLAAVGVADPARERSPGSITRSTAASIWPELCPGDGVAVTSADVKPLNRVSTRRAGLEPGVRQRRHRNHPAVGAADIEVPQVGRRLPEAAAPRRPAPGRCGRRG